MIAKRARGYKTGIKKRLELLECVLRVERESSKSVEECYACGDPAVRKRFHGKPVCGDCLAELERGVVKNQNINFFGGRGTMEDDSGPWGQNAIRCLEDG